MIDTSVWIDYFNGKEIKETNILDEILSGGNAVIGDLILLEILQGFRTDKDYNLAKNSVKDIDQYELFGKQMVDKCAGNYRSLRKKGITIRKTADVIIATFCIENNMPLLFSDRDFLPFVEHLNLTTISQEI